MKTQTEELKDLENMAAIAGISMADACKKSGVSYSTYWRWTQGKGARLASIMKLIAVVKAAGCVVKGKE